MSAPELLVADPDAFLYVGDCLDHVRDMRESSIAGVVTSPPYLDLRPEYPSPSLPQFGYLFRELARVVTGGIALNVGRLWRDGVEVRWYEDLLEEARRAGWALRDTAVWVKPNPNPIIGPVFANAHEYVFLLSRSPDAFRPDAIRLPYQEGSIERLRRRWISNVSVKGDTSERNGKRRDERRGERKEANPDGARAPSAIVVPVGKAKGNAHPAPMPLDLALPLVELVSAPGEYVLDPFAGSGTTLLAARALGRIGVGVELDRTYALEAAERLSQQSLFAAVAP
jgi:DNA modification methylase